MCNIIFNIIFVINRFYFTLLMLLGLSNTLFLSTGHFRETCIFLAPMTIIAVKSNLGEDLLFKMLSLWMLLLTGGKEKKRERKEVK